MNHIIFKIGVIFLFLFITIATAFAQPKNGTKTKFYNFDDLLIDGKVTKPKVLYTDAKQKVKFERLLKLKKSFLPKLVNSRKDPSLR